MPTKFKPSQTVRERGTGRIVTTNYWIKGISKEELLEEINKENPNKKRRAKAIREIERRGLKINWVPRNTE